MTGSALCLQHGLSNGHFIILWPFRFAAPACIRPSFPYVAIDSTAVADIIAERSLSVWRRALREPFLERYVHLVDERQGALFCTYIGYYKRFRCNIQYTSRSVCIVNCWAGYRRMKGVRNLRLHKRIPHRHKNHDPNPTDYFGQILFGIAVFLFGLRIFVSPRWYAIFKDTYVDFGDHHRFWGSVSMFAGLAFSVLALWIKARSKKSKNAGDNTTEQ